MSSRRKFLTGMAAATMGAAAWMAWPAKSLAVLGRNDGQDTIPIPGEDGMIIRSYRFLDLETPPEFFNTWLTPVPRFFVRNHMHEPVALNLEDWRLSVSGEVERPFKLTLGELLKLQTHAVVNTLECAGNGRGLMRPQVPGVQWSKGAVGTARFSGPRMRDLLQRAGLKATGKHVIFTGLDSAPGEVPPFVRSVPLEKAMDADTLIATHMNGAQLTRHHGFPARALVPGWIGAASCKWLTEIEVSESPFEGNFMRPGYTMPNQPIKPGAAVKPEDTHPLTALNVKSVIFSPLEGAKYAAGKLMMVHGVAWAGEAKVTKVEISTDGGGQWHPSRLGPDQARYAWRLWNYDWKPEKGDYAIMARATDSQGRTQPGAPAWNPSGYLYNAIDSVKVHVG